jgi:hypothetical protein
MIISEPEIKFLDERVVVAAQVTYEKRPLNKPETAWFSFPEKYSSVISGRADPFAVGLLQLAMVLNEDLIINGQVSPQLITGMNMYQRAMNTWFPELMHPIKIKAANQKALSSEVAGQNCVTLFSGGVDSSYTLMTHLPDRQQEPAAQVKDALFIHGLDIPLQNQSSYQGSLAFFKQQISPLDIELIPCATNLRYFTSGLMNWGLVFGSAVISTGLVLDQLTGSLLVPSSSIDETIPWGSTPLIDPLLSTETIRVFHDGDHASRTEKTEAISNWEPAQNFLRVCVDEERRSPNKNCSQCEKCIRTMTMLELCGTLPKFKTFQGHFGKWDILKWTPHYEHGEFWMPETMAFVRARMKNEYIFPLRIADLKGKLRNVLRNLIPLPLFNWLKQRKFPYSKDMFNPDHIDHRWYGEN